jgi:hypothetical protein
MSLILANALTWQYLFIIATPQFYLYYTDSLTQQHAYHCLYYYARDNITYYPPELYIGAYQIIEYCLRPKNINSTSIREEPRFHTKTAYTFAQLYRNGVTCDELLSWSAPIDLVENYQIYLNDKNDSVTSSLEYHRCSSEFYFGPHCQYTFTNNEEANELHSFSQVVRNSFNAKKRKLGDINLTCYEHLVCDRGPPPSCLDWREICDGKTDCTSGIDEHDCYQLEMNECASDEYRCHRGSHCVPATFLSDDPLNPDCLDGTDEPMLTGNENDIGVSPTKDQCYLDPTFRCEERTCRRDFDFPCGDGDCIQPPIPTVQNVCFNDRQKIFSDAVVTYSAHSSVLTKDCLSAMLCMTNISREYRCLNRYALMKTIQKNCPDSEFTFPSPFNHSLMLGHVKLVYMRQNWYNDARFYPKYICYDGSRCPFLRHSSIEYIFDHTYQCIE